MEMEGSEGIETLDFSKMKVPELKKELKARGLSTAGNKNDLLERLQGAMKEKSDSNGENVDELEDDLLNDDDDEHLDESDTVLGELDSTLDTSIKAKPQKRRSDANETTETEQPKAKKIILNRTPSLGENVPTNGSSKAPEDGATEDKEESSEKKVIKLSGMDAKERLELRAKKFGATAAVTAPVVNALTDDKKSARAERFGITGISDSTSKKIAITNTNTSIDALKQRAQRFGGSVSSVMTKLEEQERLEKRKQRFGAAVAGSNGAAQTDKAKLRLERFKQ